MSIISANSIGHCAGHFTVPANEVAGKKLVEFTGAGGSSGSAIYTGSNILINEVKFKEIATQPRCEPLAQTFTLTNPAMITGVDLWFTANGTTDVIVQIRNTGFGVPAEQILAETRLPQASRNTTSYTRFVFDYPLLLDDGVEYAIVIQCDDAVSAVKIASLGQFDSVHQKWITSQPYTVGTLLSSSNASTWTAQQISDLTFRLLSPAFTQTSLSVDLGHITVSGISDIMMLGNTYLPTFDTNITFTLTMVADSNRTFNCTLNQAVALPALYTGQVNIQANLTGTSSRAPVLGEDVSVATGIIATSGDYISRLFPTNSGTTMTVILDVYTVGSATVTVFARTSADTAWTQITNTTSRAIEDGYAEISYTLTGLSETNTRVKIHMTGTFAYRPSAKNLRVALT